MTKTLIKKHFALNTVDSTQVYDASDAVYRYQTNCNGLATIVALPPSLAYQPRSAIEDAIMTRFPPPNCALMSAKPVESTAGGQPCESRLAGFVCELPLDGNAADFNELY